MGAKRYLYASAGIVVFFVLVLYLMGRIPFCECGAVRFWGGVRLNSEMSQQFADIYSPSHFLHGVAFFWVLWTFRKKISLSLGAMFLAALVVEAGWEIFENTDFIINRYREVTISYDYYGDSISNSVGDVIFMALGFLFAARTPWWASVAAVLVFELGILYLIRDNLTLNVIMLVYPFESILRWQQSGG